MAKILKETEMFDIIRRASNEIDCADSYRHFLEDLGTLIADHFGSDRGSVDFDPGDGLDYTCAFHVCVPADGGIFKDYDPEIIWRDGKKID